MSQKLTKYILLTLALIAAAIAWYMRPTTLLADTRPPIDLETLLPTQFGTWRYIPSSSTQVVNPQQEETIKKIYTQTLTRSYVNDTGKVIMLSLAYGKNQTDGVALHFPEICYPAQGFQLEFSRKSTLPLEGGMLPVKQLMTKLGNRSEPVTYWTTVGDQVVNGGSSIKFAQLSYGFRGFIPDGLLFRVSSITPNSEEGFALQARFVQDLLPNLSESARTTLLGSKKSGSNIAQIQP